MYPIGTGNVIFIERYTVWGSLLEFDAYAYDFDNDEQPEIWRWDLDRDGGSDVVEYDVDGDSVPDFALADMNDNGQFEKDEIYMYQSTTRMYLPLIPGQPPLSFSLIFPY